jgi:adenylate cyclase
MRCRFLFCVVFLLGSFLGLTQQTTPPAAEEDDSTIVNTLLQQSKENFGSDLDKARALSIEARNIAEKIQFRQGAAYAFKNIGITYYFQGKYAEALDNYNQSLDIFKEIRDNVGIANLYSNIGVIYYDQGVDDKALENYLQSLKYSELAGDKFRILIALNNIGGVYNIKEATYDKALEYYLKALPICEELGKTEELGTIAVNIGSIYFDKNDDAKALFYFNKSLAAYGKSEGSLNAYNALGKLYKREQKFDLALESHNQALSIAEKVTSKISIVQSLMGLGNVYADRGDPSTALRYYHRAEVPAVEIQANHELKDLYQEMARAYHMSRDFRNAFRYQTLYSNTKDTLYNIETDKKLGSLQFDFDLQKKQGEINLLTKDKALGDLRLKRQQFAKNALIVGLTLVLLIALLIYRNYRAKSRTNKILDRQKAEIERLLLNTLPAEIAKELQETGSAAPRNYESVAVMFTDFKGFSAIAEKMPPQELVEELSTCFISFDDIIGKYNLEKIKTIGDSYMCAGGIPSPDPDYVFNVVKAAIEIRDFMAQLNKRKIEAGEEPWEVRIGVNVGPVVAGVVGKKKYAYDIWGGAVNIASRMESNGKVGEVNISAGVYEMIKEDYDCVYRGKIFAKNIGEIDMYFINRPTKKEDAQITTIEIPNLASKIS